ncbi:MAG: bacteriohemerythrin [Clostridia bacterium]|jgi:hemerythrin|nr:bacteriohemerythrin [Clostridia bacterium]
MFEWKDDYSTGVVAIDNQHKKLLEIGGELYGIVKDMKQNEDVDNFDTISDILEELENYTVEHFSYEEKLMEENGYDDLNAHKMHHAAFVAKIQELRAKDIDENQSAFLLDMVEFVADWIVNHIMKVDSKYKVLFALKGLAD